MSLALKIDEERELARLEITISVLKKFRNLHTKQDLADALELDLPQLDAILAVVDANPDKTDWEIAEIIYG